MPLDPLPPEGEDPPPPENPPPADPEPPEEPGVHVSNGMWIGLPDYTIQAPPGGTFGHLSARTLPSSFDSLGAHSESQSFPGNLTGFHYGRRIAYIIHLISALEEMFSVSPRSEFTMRDYYTHEKTVSIIPNISGGGGYTLAEYEQRLSSIEQGVAQCTHFWLKELIDDLRAAVERLYPNLWFDLPLGSVLYGSLVWEKLDNGLDFDLSTNQLFDDRRLRLAGGGRFPDNAFDAVLTIGSDTRTVKPENNDKSWYLPTETLLPSSNPNTGGWNDESESYLTGPDTDTGWFKAMRFRRGQNNYPPDRQILSEFNMALGTLPARAHSLFYSKNIDHDGFTADMNLQKLQSNPTLSQAFWTSRQSVDGGAVTWTHGNNGAYGISTGPGTARNNQNYLASFPVFVFCSFHWSGSVAGPNPSFSLASLSRRWGWQGNAMGKVWRGTIWQWFSVWFGKEPDKILIRFRHRTTLVDCAPIGLGVGMYMNADDDEEGVGSFPGVGPTGPGLSVAIPQAGLFTSGVVDKQVEFDCTESFQREEGRFPLYFGCGIGWHNPPGPPTGAPPERTGSSLSCEVTGFQLIARYSNIDVIYSERGGQFPSFGS